MQNLQLRYSNMEDSAILNQWLEDEENWPYFPIGSQKEAAVFAYNWIGFSKYKASLTCLLNNEIVAIGTIFLMPYKKVSHSPLFYLIVDKQKRGQGIGTNLLKNLLNLAEKYFHLEALIAEVYQGSQLISLLEKNKFQQFAFQENYIKDVGNKKNPYLARILFQRFLKKSKHEA